MINLQKIQREILETASGNSFAQKTASNVASTHDYFNTVKQPCFIANRTQMTYEHRVSNGTMLPM